MGNQDQADPGKLKIPLNFRKVLEEQPFNPLDVTAEHAHAIGELPPYHRDPFDRMLVAQAKIEGLTLVTRDIRLKEYKVRLLKG